ncbi:PD-(D/E)XK motif protein [Mesobacillus maritimus]|uniref:PD-(D/E)XK motif protein n=1 Tax=Mesobacillus maritimus TaxID=1643336 RepID=UPI002040A074|nr:PD-(D/E)XK motif protein [Mesobacillus maritimus]MCM3671073.1 PD-(D/E)XK motif protein [Mesobacillus maritimus]
MVDIKKEFQQMIAELENEPDREAYKIRVIHPKVPVMLAGIDIINKHRQLYIDLGTEGWEQDQIISLPKWRGLSLKVEYFEKLVLLKKHYFLVITQETEQSSDIFEMVLQNLLDHTINKQKDETLFYVIYKVLDKWRNFFQRGGYRKLTEEMQRGLFGELWFIQDWLNRNPGIPPLLIEQWEGPTSGRIDFKNSKCGVEIKTTNDKLLKTIKISNEKQLKLSTAVSKLFLYVCFIEQSKSHGTSLEAMVLNIREALAERSDRLALIFNDFLLELGFKEDQYADSYYFVEKVEVFEVTDDFPKISSENLPIGISHVSYSLDLSHCLKFEKKADEVFEVF